MNATERILRSFLDEALPEGGIDMARSRWQKPGRGYGGRFPDHPDVRYLRPLVDALYRISGRTGNPVYRQVADHQVGFMARFARETHPTWLWGDALEVIGTHHRHGLPDPGLQEAVGRIVSWARGRRVQVDTGEVSYGHFPCGYGCLGAKDAGWTNDLSLFGSGLVSAHEVTGDATILEDAVSFAEYFVRPWRPGALGPDGYWHAGTWRDDIGGSWVVGPLHYSGFESTDLYGDEASWVFSTYSCTVFLMRLYRYRPDPRYLDRCLRAAQWAVTHCQFEDGAVGICGRDDKWYGCAGSLVGQVAAILRAAGPHPDLPPLMDAARRSYRFLTDRLSGADPAEMGVEWVNRTTLPDPMVNVGWLWLAALNGVLDGQELFGDEREAR